MAASEPLKDVKKVELMKQMLSSNSRDLNFYICSINSSLRASDVLQLKVSDFFHRSGRFRTYLDVIEQKTGKRNKLLINDAIKKSLKVYVEEEGLEYDDYLFPSRKGQNVPVSRIQMYRVIKKAAENLGIENFSLHGLRKTFAYFCYLHSGKDIAVVSRILNHSSPAITMRYLGLTQQSKDEVLSNFQL